MPEELKLVAAFTIGLGAGILASKRFFQLKYERIANEEIESVKQSFSRRSGHILETSSLDKPEDFKAKIEEKRNDRGDITYYSSLEYDKISPITTSPAYIHNENDDLKAEQEHPEDDRPDDTYQISEETFSETELGYDKRTLHYYMDDDILVDAVDGDLNTGETLLPKEYIDLIRNSDDAELYFRDDSYGVDYEVLRMKGSYYIDV